MYSQTRSFKISIEEMKDMKYFSPIRCGYMIIKCDIQGGKSKLLRKAIIYDTLRYLRHSKITAYFIYQTSLSFFNPFYISIKYYLTKLQHFIPNIQEI